jgi:hypothetical protein
MPRLRTILLPSLAVLAFAIAARPCGPDFPEAIFVLTTGPDGNYADYVSGHLGVPQSDYRTRHLVVAYNYLTARPLSADEQQQAITVNKLYVDNSWQFDDSKSKSAPPTGPALWLAARAPIGQVDNDNPATQPVSRSVPGSDYESFDNCLNDAFATAARTLTARVASYGTKDPAVIEWVRGQDAVFSNCGDGKPAPYYGPGTPPPPPPAPHSPTALPANAPAWLKQDRAYQLAAADFYALRFDQAIAEFRAIAADAGSPWSLTARYLVARALIRKATLAPTPPDGNLSGTPLTDEQRSTRQAAYQQQLEQAAHQRTATLQQAQHELLAMQRLAETDPRMAPMRTAIDNLLDYVNLRYAPDAQAATLATRLHNQPSPKFGQSLIDLTYLRTNPSDMSLPPTTHPKPTAPDILLWIDAVSTNNETAALQHWRATHSNAWLLAAISFAQPADAATPELLTAAAAVSRSDPAWTAVTYHRLRLLPRDAAMRRQLLAVLPMLDKAETSSTVNLFTTLNAATAPTLDAWLATAGRYPASEGYDNGNSDAPSAPTEDVCGKKIVGGVELFDTDAAVALNRDMPLRLLAQAAESNTLPANLRFQVAQAAWARAVLLDQPDLAHRLTPVLLACRATWKPVLDAYDASTTPDDRHANGLLALMRFASTEPSVREGEERRSGFATYDSFRQNWWCTTVPKAGVTVDYEPGYTEAPQPTTAPPPPLFLTAADLADARTEVAALEKIPNASTYFALQALAWMKLHPQDPRTADILGEADRVLRNSCRVEQPTDPKTGQPTGDPHNPMLTPNLAHALFDALHTHYPTSPWTKRYTSWQ